MLHIRKLYHIYKSHDVLYKGNECGGERSKSPNFSRDISNFEAF